MKKIIDTPKIFESNIRLQMIASLAISPLSYKELKEICNCSDGNMCTHTKRLLAENYIYEKKEFKNNKPLTTYYLTKKGNEEFISYVQLLNQLVENLEEQNEEKDIINNLYPVHNS